MLIVLDHSMIQWLVEWLAIVTPDSLVNTSALRVPVPAICLPVETPVETPVEIQDSSLKSLHSAQSELFSLSDSKRFSLFQKEKLSEFKSWAATHSCGFIADSNADQAEHFERCGYHIDNRKVYE